MNYIEEYYKQIQDNSIVVSKKIKNTYAHIVKNMHDANNIYTYNNNNALKVINFIEKFCRHNKGKTAGKPFILELWQKALLSALFGFVHKETGLRQYRELVLIVARKNGKSMLASAIATYLLFADKEAAPELYSVATKRDQARIIWQETTNIIKKSDPLKKHAKILKNEIKTHINNGIFKPLSSDSNSLDGLNVHAAFIDELHAIKDKNLYDVVVDDMAARQQPLSIITTTNGMIRENIFDLKYQECTKIVNGYVDKNYADEKILPIIYELDDRNEIYDKKNWYKANPGLGTIKNMEQLQDKVKRAIADNRLMPNLLCKDFNIPINGFTAFFDPADIINNATFSIKDLNANYYIGGWDLSQVRDLTSACILIVKDNKFYYKHMYWMPEDTLKEHIERDQKPYDIWLSNGLLRTCSGNVINPADIFNWYQEQSEKYNIYPYKFAYDPYGSGWLGSELATYYGKDVLYSVKQIKKNLSIPMQKIQADLQKRKVIYNNNPITIWNMASVEADIDINGNIQPAKNRNIDGNKIDGFACMLNAYACFLENQEEYTYMN